MSIDAAQLIVRAIWQGQEVQDSLTALQAQLTELQTQALEAGGAVAGVGAAGGAAPTPAAPAPDMAAFDAMMEQERAAPAVMAATSEAAATQAGAVTKAAAGFDDFEPRIRTVANSEDALGRSVRQTVQELKDGGAVVSTTVSGYDALGQRIAATATVYDDLEQAVRSSAGAAANAADGMLMEASAVNQVGVVSSETLRSVNETGVGLRVLNQDLGSGQSAVTAWVTGVNAAGNEATISAKAVGDLDTATANVQRRILAATEGWVGNAAGIRQAAQAAAAANVSDAELSATLGLLGGSTEQALAFENAYVAAVGVEAPVDAEAATAANGLSLAHLRLGDSLGPVRVNASALGPVMAAMAAGMVAVASVDIAAKLQDDTVQLANFAQIGEAQAHAVLGTLNSDFNTGTSSAAAFAGALAPMAGMLQQVTGGTLDSAQAQEVAAAAENLALAGHEHLAEATRSEVTVLRDFQLAASDSAMVSNALFDSQTRTGQSTQTITAGYGLLHEELGSLNPSLQDVKTLFDAANQAGGDTPRIINAIATGLDNAVRGQKAETEMLDRANISLKDQQGNLLPLPQMYESVVGGLQRLTQADADQVSAAVFGASNSQKVIDALGIATQAYETGAGSVDRYAQAQASAAREQGTLTGLWEQARAKASDVGAAIGNFLVKAYLDAVEAGDKAIGGMGRFIAAGGRILELAGVTNPAMRSMGEAMVTFGNDVAGAADKDLASARSFDAAFTATAEGASRQGETLSSAAYAASAYGERLAAASAGTGTLSASQADLKKQSDLLIEAQVAEIGGLTEKGALLRQEAADYGLGTAAGEEAGAQVADQIKLLDAETSARAKQDEAAKRAQAAAEEAARGIVTANDAIAKASAEAARVEQTNSDLVTGSFAKKHDATQQSIDDEMQLGLTLQGQAEGSLASFEAANNQYIADLQNQAAALAATSPDAAKYWADRASEAQTAAAGFKSSFESQTKDSEAATSAGIADMATLRAANDATQKQIAEATRQSASDQRTARADEVSFEKEAVAGLPAVWQVALSQAEAAVRASNATILADDQALQAGLTGDALKAAQDKRVIDAAAVSDAKANLAELLAASKLPSPEMEGLQIQVDQQNLLKDATQATAIANERGNLAIQTQIDSLTIAKDREDALLQSNKDRLAILQSQSGVISDQIALNNDLLAASGQTAGTDPKLLRLNVERDTLALAGQSTAEVDKQISQEQARIKLKSDQNALDNLGLTQQQAQNKLAQDRLKLASDTATADRLSAAGVTDTVGQLGLELKTRQDIQKLASDQSAETERLSTLNLQLKVLQDQKALLDAMATPTRAPTPTATGGAAPSGPNTISVGGVSATPVVVVSGAASQWNPYAPAPPAGPVGAPAVPGGAPASSSVALNGPLLNIENAKLDTPADMQNFARVLLPYLEALRQTRSSALGNPNGQPNGNPV